MRCNTRSGNTYKETGSGGALGGGSATINVIYSPVIATKGVWANGKAIVAARLNPIVLSAGSLAAGTADIAAANGYGANNTYDEVMTGGASITGWSDQKFIESHLGWKCRTLNKYIPGMFVKPERERSRRGALVAGITVCDQGIYYKLLKEGDTLAR